MRIKKLVALALAGTMVFSMAACGSKKDEKSSGNQAVNGEASEVTLDSVLDAFGTFTEEQDKNYSADTSMVMKMKGEGVEVYMDMKASSSSFDGVTYAKTTTKTDMLGEDVEEVEESYTITKEDGSVVMATKAVGDEEWDVDTTDAEDVEEVTEKFDIEAAKKTAKMEKDGDNCYVTMNISATEMGLESNELLGDMSDFKVTVKVTYNAKEGAVTEVSVEFDLDALNEMFAALGAVEVTEFSMKVDNIKKNDKVIEIPDEIQLD